jgi:hypothetical protein
MKETWRRYSKNNNALWVPSHASRGLDFWSTCVYLINIPVMRRVIDEMAVYDSKGVLNMKILAGVTNPCVPHACCNGTQFYFDQSPCVYAPKGYQADSFIYASTK